MIKVNKIQYSSWIDPLHICAKFHRNWCPTFYRTYNTLCELKIKNNYWKSDLAALRTTLFKILSRTKCELIPRLFNFFNRITLPRFTKYENKSSTFETIVIGFEYSRSEISRWIKLYIFLRHKSDATIIYSRKKRNEYNGYILLILCTFVVHRTYLYLRVHNDLMNYINHKCTVCPTNFRANFAKMFLRSKRKRWFRKVSVISFEKISSPIFDWFSNFYAHPV